MRRFVLRENIARYRRHLDGQLQDETRATILRLLGDARAELSELERQPILDAGDGAGLLAVADQAVRAVIEEQEGHFANLQLLDEASGRLTIIAHANLPLTFLRHFEIVSCEDDPACAQCVRLQAPVAVRDVLADAAYGRHHEVARQTGYRALMSAPLRIGRACIGVVSVLYAAPRRISGAQIARMAAQADRIAPVLARHLA